MPILTDDIDCRSILVRGAISPPQPRSSLAQESYSEFDISHCELRIWDAVQTNLTTAGTDDLGLTAGAHGTGIWYVTAGSLGSAGATTRRARFRYLMPYNYVTGQSAKFTFQAGITGSVPNVADASCTLDAEVFKFGSNVLVSGSDLYAGAAQSINSTTFADYDFDLTVTSLSAGDLLDVRLSITCTDAGSTAANVVPAITRLKLKCHTKG